MTLLADGFDEALLGFGHYGGRTLAVYDYQKCVDVLIERDGMDAEAAEEHMQYNVIGAWMGEHTPVFLDEDLQVGHDD